MRLARARWVPWAALGTLFGLTVGAASVGAAGTFGSASSVLQHDRTAGAGVSSVPAPSESPTTAPGVGTPTTTATTIAHPATPPPPGPLAVDPTAWRGHGDLAFVSEGQLEVLGNDSTLTAITGPPAGTDTNPQWSPDGRWLAFLNTGPGSEFVLPPPTLWVVHVGGSGAQQVSTSGIAQYAWSPVSDVLAYTTSTGNELTPASLWTDVPGAAPTYVAEVGPGPGDLAWTPDGTRLAFDDAVPVTRSPTGRPTSSLSTVALAGGTPQTAYQLTDGSSLRLAGWWPGGGGLLFWIDPDNSASLAETGLLLYGLAAGSSVPIQLARSLVGQQWLAPAPTGSTLAVVAGGGRTLWSPGRVVDRCDVPSGACQPAPIGQGTVGLAPAWTPSGGLLYAVSAASTGQGELPDAYYPGSMAHQDATSALWYLAPGAVTAQPLTQAGNAVVADQVGATGDAMLVVRDDALWLTSLTSSSPATRIATPLYSSAGPSGYYAEVDWIGTFAWSGGIGRSGAGQSASPFYSSLAGPHPESP